jgi:hypothetical protein
MFMRGSFIFLVVDSSTLYLAGFAKRFAGSLFGDIYDLRNLLRGIGEFVSSGG